MQTGQKRAPLTKAQRTDADLIKALQGVGWSSGRLEAVDAIKAIPAKAIQRRRCAFQDVAEYIPCKNVSLQKERKKRK